MIGRLLALGVFAASLVYLANAWPLPLGTAARPGPGFYPMAVGVFGAAVTLGWVVSAFQQTPATVDRTVMDRPSRTRVSATCGLLVGFCLLLPWIGYPLAALLFTGLLLRGLGARWSAAAIVAAGSALGS